MHVRILTAVLCIATILTFPARAQSQTASPGDVVITEIMYAPAGTDSDQEFVEVYNTTDQAIDLEDWVLISEDPSSSDPVQDDVNSSVEVGSHEFAVLCENDDTSVNGGVQCDYDYANRINHTNTSDYVVLRDGSGTEIDRVHYDEEGGWPEAIDASLEYLGGPAGDNNDFSNWQVASAQTGDYVGTSGSNLGSPNANAPGSALPVELTSFSVRTEGARAVVQWTTASETRNAGFVVQRRVLGEEDWSRQGFVEGEGTTTEAQSYRLSVQILRPGLHEFRLKQVDVDGSTHYSDAERVWVRTERDLTVQGPNPVPSGRSLTVLVEGRRGEEVEVGLYDLLGRRVRTLSLRSEPSRVGRARLSTEGLAGGVYVLQVRGRGIEAARKITVTE